MANAVTFQTLIDGPKNVVIKVVGILDSSDLSSTTLVDPALLSSIMPGWPSGNILASTLRIDFIDYSIEDSLEVKLHWNATTPTLIEALTGRGNMDFRPNQMLQNNAGAGKDGKINISTNGWVGTKTFTLTLGLAKQATFA